MRAQGAEYLIDIHEEDVIHSLIKAVHIELCIALRYNQDMDSLITKEILKEVRVASRLTQAEAASMVRLGSNVRWMEYERGIRVPDPARAELFIVKVAMRRGFSPISIDSPEDVLALAKRLTA